MNRLQGIIREIENKGNLSLVQIEVGENQFLYALVVEKPSESAYLTENREIAVMFKESEVILTKGNCEGLGLQNCLAGKILDWREGQILSEVEVEFGGGSIKGLLTTSELKKLDIQKGDPIRWLVKTSEVSLGEIHD